MFPTQNRLRKTRDINSVYNSRKVLSNDYIRIHFDFNASGPEKKTQIAIVCSKKIGKAHERNKLKRLIRESLRELGVLNLDKSLRLVIVTKPGIRNLEYNSIKETLDSLIQRLRY